MASGNVIPAEGIDRCDRTVVEGVRRKLGFSPMVKHVYLLGAGFSVPLGGPLFRELLTSEIATTTNYLIPREPTIESRLALDLPLRLCSFLKRHGYKAGSNLNAEQILELAEGLVTTAGNWFSKMFFNELKSELIPLFPEEEFQKERLYRFIKSQIAFETHRFLAEIHHHSERWEPFDLWFRDLSSKDSVLTTNYDLVFEELNDRLLWANKNPMVPLPYHGKPRSKLTDFGPAFLKLHGSLSWHFSDSEVFETYPIRVNDLHTRNVAIGLPGISKGEFASVLSVQQWMLAQELLTDAEVISVIGYSLPETDNILRTKF
jgi:hypothetical protein